MLTYDELLGAIKQLTPEERLALVGASTHLLEEDLHIQNTSELSQSILLLSNKQFIEESDKFQEAMLTAISPLLQEFPELSIEEFDKLKEAITTAIVPLFYEQFTKKYNDFTEFLHIIEQAAALDNPVKQSKPLKPIEELVGSLNPEDKVYTDEELDELKYSYLTEKYGL